MTGAERAQGAGRDLLPALDGGALQDQLADRGGEARVGAHGGRPAYGQAQFGCLGRGLRVEVVEDLHVVGDEADGCHDDRGDAGRVALLQVVADVGLQPRDVRGAGAGLVDELPGVVDAGALADGVGDQPGHVQVLLDVRPAVSVVLDRAGAVRGGGRDGVGREGEMRAVPDVLGEVGKGFEDPVDHRLQEAGVVEVVAQLVDLREVEALGIEGGQGVGEVLPVLAAARVRGIGAGGEDQDAAAAVGDHLAQGVREVRGPVAVAPVDRQVQAVVREVLAEGVQEGAVLVVDGADPAEQEVVLAHFLEAFLGDASPTRHVLQERNHVVRTFGAAEREQEEGVVGGGIEHVWHASDPATRH